MKKLLGIILFSTLVIPLTTFAQTSATIADIANGFVNQFDGIYGVLGAVAYITGIGFGIKGIMKLKESNESKGQVKLSTAIVHLIAAAILLALPTSINIGIEALGFDKGGQSTFKY